MNLGTPIATKVIGAGTLLLVAALGWTFVVGPEVNALAEVRLSIEETSSQNDVLALQLASLEKQSKNLEDTRSAALDLAAKFPPTADQPGLFKAVTAAAVDAGIGAKGVTTLAPTAPVIGGVDPETGEPAAGAGPLLARQLVSVAIVGSYDQTRRLLANLEQMPRAYLVSSVTLVAGEQPGTFVTDITGDMFVMPPVPDPADPPVDPPSDPADPADPTEAEG